MRRADWTSDDGTIALHHCPCEELLASLAPRSVDLVVTSPPFNTLAGEVNDFGYYAERGGNRYLEKLRSIGYDDRRPEPEYQAWLRSIVADCLRASKGLAWINHKTRGGSKRGVRGLIHPLSFLPFDFWDMVIWNRLGSMANNSANNRRFRCASELLIGFGQPAWFDDAGGWSDVWDDIRPSRGNEDHPCPWPVEIPRRLIVATCEPRGLVLDPFIGIGTTAVACVRTGRACIGAEIREDYFEASVRNVQAEPGREILFRQRELEAVA
jgi:DNA modification methylase